MDDKITIEVLEEDLKTEMDILKHDEEALDIAMQNVERTKRAIQELKDKKDLLVPIVYPNE